MVEFLSGRVKKTPSSEVSEDRYSYLKLEEAEPDLGVPSSNNAILISDSTGNRDWLFVSDGLSISVSNTGVYSLSHDNTSDVANLVLSSRTYVTELSFDQFGHVLSYSTGTETVVDTDTFVVSASFNTSDGILTLTRNDANTVTVDLDGRYLSESGPGSGLDADLLDGEEGTYYLDWSNFTNTPDATITVSGTSGLTGSGSFAVDDFANTSISLSHDNTSDVANLSATSRTYVTGLTFDEFGHVVSYTTDTETVTDTDTFVNSASFNTSDGILTLTRNDANTVTVDLDGRYLTSESDDLDSVTTRGSTTTNNITVGDLTADNVTFQGNLQIDGTLTVSGNVVTINATELSVDDNMIYLNANASFTNPDLGVVGAYNDGTYAHAGIFRDATDGRWKIFDGYTPEPDESIYINTAHPTFSLADFQAETIYGDLVGNATTATTLETARTVSLTGDASGSFDFDGSANVSFSVTVNDSDQLDGQDGTYYLDWTNFTNTPDATITVSGTSGLTGTGSFAVDDFANTTISLSHDNTSDVANLVATSRTYVTGLTFDEFGHVVSYTTDTETVTDTDTFVNALSFDANTGILTVTRNDTVSLNVDLDTRYLSASGPGSGLDADTLDGQQGTYYLDYNNFTNVPIIGDGTIIVNTGSGLTGSGTFSVNDESNTTFTLSHDNTSDVANLATATGVYVNGITFDEFGHVVSYTTETATSASDTYVISGSYDANTSTLSLTRNDSNTVNISFGSLNADTLDFLDSSQFVRSDVSDTISGDITFSANVTFDTVTISSVQTSIDAFVDSDSILMTAAAIDDRIAAAGGGLTQEQEDIFEILQDDSSYFYTAIGDLYTKAEPSGSDTYIQYNNAGVFGSDSTFTFNDATKTLSVPNISVSGIGGNITAASATITGDATFSANVTFDTVTISSIQTSSDSFVDSDNELMTAAAIDDRIAIVAGVDALKLLQDDSSYFYTAIGDLYTKAEPSGSDSFVQYNNAGIFGSDSTFTFNDATNTLSVPNIVISSQSTLTNLSVSGNTDLDIVTANTIATDGNVTIGGTLNTYSIDAIYDRGILNSADSAYFFTKIEEIEGRNLKEFGDTFILPTTDGTNGQALLTNGSGTISFGDVVQKTGTPANNQIAVWVNNGTIEGDSNLTWNGSIFDINGSVSISEGIYDSANTLGTNGQVLTSNGSAVIWSTPSGGSSGLVLLETITCNNTFSTVDIPLSSSYDAFIMECVDIRGGAYAFTRMLVSEDGGSTFESSGYAAYRISNLLSMGTDSTSINNSTSVTNMIMDQSASFSGQIFITNSDTLYQQRAEFISNELVFPSTYYHKTQSGGLFVPSSRVDYLRMYRDSSDNFVSGTIYLYGLTTT